MQRKATKTTRGPNAKEKAFMAWVKQQPCCICGTPGPSIADHMYGATQRHNKVLIGMWALLPYCQTCDAVKTGGSHRAHLASYGRTQAELWAVHVQLSPIQPPADVIAAIQHWGR